MEKLTIIVVAKDEEKMIFDCLESVKWADEILVIDHGSIDKTAQIAKKFNSKVIKLRREEKPNFSLARNIGLKKATGNWILYIDADERITPKLKEEILEILKNSQFAYYAIPRINYVFGKALKHGGWYPDYVKRLFKKNALKGWKGDLHEEPVIIGEIGHLKCDLNHIKHETVSEMIQKTNKWSEIEANLMYKSNHPKMNILRFFSAIWREFYYRMIKNMAFLDGSEGIIMAFYQVWSRFVSYSKLYELQLKNEKS